MTKCAKRSWRNLEPVSSGGNGKDLTLGTAYAIWTVCLNLVTRLKLFRSEIVYIFFFLGMETRNPFQSALLYLRLIEHPHVKGYST